MRFAPPPLPSTPELLWLLARGFGPPDGPAPPLDEVDRAWNLAAATGLGARIAARTGAERLEAELGPLAGVARQAAETALAHALAYEGVAAEVGAVARAVDVPVIALKGMALHLGGYAAAGSRHLGDLDLLAPTDGAPRLHRALREAGFRPSGDPRNEHHLPTLEAPGWGKVDLHDRLRGVAAPNGRWLDASAVAIDAGRGRDGVAVPAAAPLAAHLVAHGIDQHAFAPQPFPLLRSIADLADVLAPSADRAAVRSEVTALLAASLSADEADGAFDLVDLLDRGGMPSEGTSAHQLLAHLIAHATDSRYRAGLEWRHRRRRLRDAWRQRRLLSLAARKWRDLGTPKVKR